VPEQQETVPGRRRARVVVAASIVIALLALGAAGYLLATRHRAANDRDGALAAARQYAVDLTTYDFATVDADFARFSRHGTQAFRTSYATTIAAAKPAIVKAQSRSIGTVVGAGLESYSSGQARVLLAVDQQIRSARQAGVTTDRSRIRMSLVRAGNGWLVTSVTVL
jgi:Mce-associated membrane protein